MEPGLHAAIIDLVNPDCWEDVTNTQTSGPFEHGTDLYMVLTYKDLALDPPWGKGQLGIYKSTDRGVSWSLIGTGITDANYETDQGRLCVSIDQPDPTKIRFMFENYNPGLTPMKSIVLGEWDMATDAYTEISRFIPIIGGGPSYGGFRYYTYDKINGVDWCFYISDLHEESARPYTAGAWGAPILLCSGVPTRLAAIPRADPTDGTVHFVVENSSGYGTAAYYQLKPDYSIVSAGAFVVPVVIDPPHLPRYANFMGSPAFTGTTMVWPLQNPLAGTVNSVSAGFWMVEPYTSSAPVITTLPDTIDPSYTILMCVAREFGGKAYFWWDTNERRPGGSWTYEVLLRYRSFDGTTWGPIVTWHDEMTFPIYLGPTVNITGLDYYLPSCPVLLADGTWGAMITWGDLVTPIGSSLYGVYLGGQPGLPTLIVTKVLQPSSDPGLFDLQIDGVTEAADQGDGGTTGAIPLAPGTYQVGEVAGTGTSLANYTTTFGGDAGPTGLVTLSSTQTDNFIDSTDWPRALAPVSQFRGVYEFGGKLWGVVIKDLHVGSILNANLRVYSSTDAGQTWIEQDSANRPLSVNAGTSFYPGTGALIYFVYKDNTTGALNYTTFAMSTPAWGAIVGGGPVTNSGSGVFMGRSSGGVFELLFRQTDGGGFTRCMYGTFDAGTSTWSAPVQVSGLGDDLPGDNQSPDAFLVDSSDVVHCFWNDTSFFADDTVWHRAVVAGTPDAAQQIYARNNFASPSHAHGRPSTPVEWNGLIAFAYAKWTGADKFPWVWYGTPAGVAAPVWTEEAVSATHNTPAGAPNQQFQTLALKGADLFYWWATYHPGAGLMNSIYYNSNSGAGWGADTLYFTDAPSNAFDDFFEQLSVTALASGAWGVFHDRIWPGYTLGGDHDSVAAFIVDSPDNKVAVITNVRNSTPPPPPPPPPQPPYSFPGSPSGPCRKTTLHLWQAARAPQVEISTDRKSDWTDCADPRNKFFQGFLLDADTYSVAKLLTVRDSDLGALHTIQPSPIVHAGRQRLAYSFETPFLAHQVRDEPLDVVAWRRFGLTYVWEPSPESVRTWKTQRTAHGLKGYQHICRIEAAYESTALVMLTLVAFDGVSPVPLALPSTGGAYQKLLLTLTPNKGQLYEYLATSTAPFRLFLQDWTCWIGEWGRPGPYLAYRNLGGDFSDKASI